MTDTDIQITAKQIVESLLRGEGAVSLPEQVQQLLNFRVDHRYQTHAVQVVDATLELLFASVEPEQVIL